MKQFLTDRTEPGEYRQQEQDHKDKCYCHMLIFEMYLYTFLGMSSTYRRSRYGPHLYLWLFPMSREAGLGKPTKFERINK